MVWSMRLGLELHGTGREESFTNGGIDEQARVSFLPRAGQVTPVVIGTRNSLL